jgi:structural maintenance of chromosome 4
LKPGPNDYEVVPDSALVISRTATAQNKSQYYINGRSSSYTEVTNLLKGRGIDLDHKRFLILQVNTHQIKHEKITVNQGEVESISQMKPKAANEHEDGLLEYLEDIIGTSGYKEKIDEAFAEMEKLTEERAERLNRVKVVEQDLKALNVRIILADHLIHR